MPNENDNNSNQDQIPEVASEADILLTRIVDQHATDQDLNRFEQLACDDPSLWRTLANQQQEMAALSDTVIEQLVAADLVELPVNSPSSKNSTAAFKPFAYIGWAAAIIISAVWIMLPASESSQNNLKLTHDQHFKEYSEADFVKQELDTILLDKEKLPNGKLRLYILRRIEEVIDVDRPLDEITDGDKLTVTPEELRKESLQTPTRIDQ